MRSYRVARRVAVLAAAVTSAFVGVAAPASADVTVNPPSAAQGSGVNLTFRVTNDNPASALTKVVLTLPKDQPIAEVHPLSVNDWAPQLTNRPLNPPIRGLHGGQLTEAVASVSWSVVPGREVPPGGAADLSVALGPLPTTSTISFTVQSTYADGSSGPASGDLLGQGAGKPVTLPLTPAAGPPPATGHGHGGTGGQPAAEPAVAVPAEPERGTSGLIGWIAAALCAAFGLAATLRARRSRPAGPTAPHGEVRDTGRVRDTEVRNRAAGRETADPEPRARVSAWSYRDGP